MSHDETEIDVEAELEINGRTSLYAGDDPRPTSKKELAGWYCYGWAAEVFTVCAMGSPYHFNVWRCRPWKLSQETSGDVCFYWSYSNHVVPCHCSSGIPFGGLLAIVANTCFGASFVLLNSFLPVLVRHHPLVIKRIQKGLLGGEGRQEVNASTPLLQSIDNDGRAATGMASLQLSLSTQISSFGIGIGYIGAVILQVISIAIVVITQQTTFSLRLVLFCIGLWWFIFTIPATLWLRSRPGPPLLSNGKSLHSWPAYMAYAWQSLGKTALRARRLKDLLLFLAAWFLLSDGIATVSGTAVLFAKTELNMKPAALGLINVIVMLAGVCGAFSWSYVSSLLRLRASHTIIACIILFELIPLYGILGFVPSVQRLGIGLQQPWEMYPLGAIYGLVMGGLSSYCRSFFAELIPPGHEAAFYALYAITDKGSSIFGPAIVGVITDRYGEIRPAFVFLAILIFLPLPLMLLVDVERGKRDALELGAELDGLSANPGYDTIATRAPEE
ncbi:Autophagy-related protein 22-1 [Penicillium verhagenii]|nr:Autophagy-related protein 22-1 [Penicillium verhagenii]